MTNNYKESAPLIENNQQFEDNVNVKIDIPTEDEDEPGPECCIYKVPSCMRAAKEEAYTPHLISIGPLHHDNQKLARMEKQKIRYYKKFSKRTSEKTLEEFSSFIESNMKRVYRCYDTEFVLNTQSETSKFIKMILYDAVFIIELFLRNFQGEASDFLFSKKWLRVGLLKDLTLLENQLPFFVLEDLYNLAFTDSDENSFFHLTCSFFEIEKYQILEQKSIKHFTDLLRSIFVIVVPPYAEARIEQVYSATMLREAGVKFKAVHSGSGLLDIKFDKGVLQIPSFSVEQFSDTCFRNVMAFEQCHDTSSAYFCGYFQLLDFLINTEKDVEILVKEGILVNQMASNQEVGDMINKLMVGVEALSLCFDKIGSDLNQFYDNSWNRTMATLKDVYFKDLWRGTATVAAFIVVALTLIQTILAVLDRVKPAN